MSSTLSSAPAPRVARIPVNTSQAARRVWLVKVPEPVFEVLSAGGAASPRVGELSPVAGARLAGAKRGRTQLRLTLDDACVVEALGAARAAGMPRTWDFTVEPPSCGARVLAVQGASCSLLGTSAVSGTVVRAGARARTARAPFFFISPTLLPHRESRRQTQRTRCTARTATRATSGRPARRRGRCGTASSRLARRVA